jgi:hypothetical protein
MEIVNLDDEHLDRLAASLGPMLQAIARAEGEDLALLTTAGNTVAALVEALRRQRGTIAVMRRVIEDQQALLVKLNDRLAR